MAFKWEEGRLDKFPEIKEQEMEKIVIKLQSVLGSNVFSEVIEKLWPEIKCKINTIVRESLKQRLMPKKIKTSIIVPIPEIKDSARF